MEPQQEVIELPDKHPLRIRAEQAEAQRDELLAALKAVTQTDDDCPVCDRGRLRNTQKTHWPECPFGRALDVIAKAEGW